MAEFPALPLFTDAYLGDTTHLTTIEHGAYLLLLMTAWRSRDCRLPNDDRLLARYTKLTTAQWKRVKPIIEPFFVVTDDGWTQRRLTDEANHVRQVRESQSQNGKASALKRKGRHATTVEPSSNQASTPTPSPTPIKEEEEDARDPVVICFDGWNAMAAKAGLPKAEKLTPKRRAAMRSRIADYTEDIVLRAIAAIPSKPWLMGVNDRNWKADFDWFVQPDSITRLREGKYDHGQCNRPANDQISNPRVQAAINRAAERAGGERPGIF